MVWKLETKKAVEKKGKTMEGVKEVSMWERGYVTIKQACVRRDTTKKQNVRLEKRTNGERISLGPKRR